MIDRRRINPPPGGTHPPIFASTLSTPSAARPQRPTRTRQPSELRKIFLQTSLVPSASGSAYLELSPSSPPSAPPSSASSPSSSGSRPSSLKLTCTIHGPHPLPRSAPYTPHLHLSTTLKFAPFATRQRRGYVRDAAERDLAAHLETALRGVVIGERWPKSGVDVVVTVLEGEEDGWWGDDVWGGEGGGKGLGGGWGIMSVLAGAITCASAAMADAGIDCVDLVSGGVAGVVVEAGRSTKGKGKSGEAAQGTVVLDPCPAEHEEVRAAAVVGYLAGRDEITELWVKGDVGADAEILIEKAVEAAVSSRTVLVEAVREAAQAKFMQPAENGAAVGSKKGVGTTAGDVVMSG